MTHLGRCKLYCTKCFYKASRIRRKCNCSIKKCELISRAICNPCSARTEKENVKKKKETERFLFTRFVQRAKKCTKCDEPLPSNNGPRWWVCGSCFGECRDDVHPSWKSVS